MVAVAFVAPYLLEATVRFVEAAARLPGVDLAVITCESADGVPPRVSRYAKAHWRIDDPLDAGQIAAAVQGLSAQIGPVGRLIGVLEQLQEPLAQVRDHLAIEGFDQVTARNFRDKAQMKSVLRAAGVPCARHQLAGSSAAAESFVAEVGFPVVVKPPAGAGAKSTFRVDDPEDLRVWLASAPPTADREALMEEFLTGDEGSFDSVMVDDTVVWHSISHYLPTPLEVLRNPWIQWAVFMPRDISTPDYGAIADTGAAALRALGLRTGLTHMEWFRRPGGTIAVSEVAIRPPGGNITSMLNYAHEMDLYTAWARVMIYDDFEPVVRRWSVGTVYLRGEGSGRVRAVRGIDELPVEVKSIVIETQLPERGQVSSNSYEGEGHIIVRHRDTDVVMNALRTLVSQIRVELA